MPSTAVMFKKRYCLDDNRACARYMVFRALGSDKVPVDLFPNHDGRARDLIAAASPATRR